MNIVRLNISIPYEDYMENLYIIENLMRSILQEAELYDNSNINQILFNVKNLLIFDTFDLGEYTDVERITYLGRDSFFFSIEFVSDNFTDDDLKIIMSRLQVNNIPSYINIRHEDHADLIIEYNAYDRYPYSTSYKHYRTKGLLPIDDILYSIAISSPITKDVPYEKRAKMLAELIGYKFGEKN